MNINFSILIQLLILQCLLGFCCSHGFNLFYFILEWPASRCNRKIGCCFPTTGKPEADFIINGLHPAEKHHTLPTFCDPNSAFYPDEFSKYRKDMEVHWPPLDCPTKDNMLRWSFQWQKHGTCSLPVFNQFQYFETAMNLKNELNLLDTLKERGIEPNGDYYSLDEIIRILKHRTNQVPQMFCNKDKYGNIQLHKIRLCLNILASKFIECPPANLTTCRPSIRFPSF